MTLGEFRKETQMYDDSVKIYVDGVDTYHVKYEKKLYNKCPEGTM